MVRSASCPACGATIEGIDPSGGTDTSDDVYAVRLQSSTVGENAYVVAAVACESCETIIGTEGTGLGG